MTFSKVCKKYGWALLDRLDAGCSRLDEIDYGFYDSVLPTTISLKLQIVKLNLYVHSGTLHVTSMIVDMYQELIIEGGGG